MESERKYTKFQLLRIFQLAEAWSRGEKDLTRIDVRELCSAVDIDESALARALDPARAPCFRLEREKLVIRSRPGLLAVHSVPVGLSSPFLWRMGIITFFAFVFPAMWYAQSGGGVIGTGVAGGVALMCGAWAIQLLREQRRAQFLVGVANHLIVGWRAPSGHVHAKRLTVTGLIAKVVGDDGHGESNLNPAATFHLMLQDRDGRAAEAFVGLPRPDLEAVLDTLETWQKAEMSRH